jgi:hypothetical protein
MQICYYSLSEKKRERKIRSKEFVQYIKKKEENEKKKI